MEDGGGGSVLCVEGGEQILVVFAIIRHTNHSATKLTALQTCNYNNNAKYWLIVHHHIKMKSIFMVTALCLYKIV